MDQILGNRRKQRFSVNNLTISINGKNYQIFNINEYGMGFLIDSPQDIEIGSEINPIFINGNFPVQLAGIPRHISQFRPSENNQDFKPGWVCGTEFTTKQSLDGGKLFLEFLAENIE